MNRFFNKFCFVEPYIFVKNTRLNVMTDFDFINYCFYLYSFFIKFFMYFFIIHRRVIVGLKYRKFF